MQIRYDKAQIKQDKKSWEYLRDGRLRVPVTLTRTGIFNYYDNSGNLIRELRSDSEVLKADSLNTLKGMYFTDEHPQELVSPENYIKYAKGSFGDVISTRKDGDITYIDTVLTVFDKETQNKIESGLKEQISCGYVCEVVMDKGTWNGQEYDAYQKDIEYNHGSLVSKGRAGNNVKIRRDSEEINGFIEIDINKKTNGGFLMKINGRDVKLDEAGEIIVSQYVEETTKKINDLEEKAKKVDTLEANLLKVEKELKQAKEINLDALVTERNNIISKASLYVKEDVKGLSNQEIMKKAVISAYPNADLSKKDDSFFNVAFDLLEIKESKKDNKSTIADSYKADLSQDKQDSNDFVTILLNASNKANKSEVK